MVDERTLAYLAGVLDTQARITTRVAAGTELPLVMLSTPNVQLLDWLAKLTGVGWTATHRQYTRHRCTEHCPTGHQYIDSQSGRWLVTGIRATVVLRAVRPWLMLQVAEADEALLVGQAASFKPAVLHKMQALGWEYTPETPQPPL